MSLRVKLEAKKTAVTRHYVATPFCRNSRGVNCGILAILFHNHFPFYLLYSTDEISFGRVILLMRHFLFEVK